MSDRIIQLEGSEIAQAMVLCGLANWNQTAQDWVRIMALEPEGCFGLECDGALAATTTVICYGDTLAWIGMVLTHPEHRGRGCARRLMEHAIAFCEQRKVAWIKLDATDMGRPLYRKLGFEDECPVERWLRPANASTQGSTRSNGQLAIPFECDRAAFGADRRRLLETLAREDAPFVLSGGYVFGRPGANASYLGPVVAADRQSALVLVNDYLARQSGEDVYWDLLPSNEMACALARGFQFEPCRRLMRMTRRGTGNAPAMVHNDSSVFAIAGFEYG